MLREPILDLFVPGDVKPAGSKRPLMAGGRLRVVDSSGDKGKQWRSDIKLTALEALNGQAMTAGPIELDLVFVFPRPQGHLRTGRRAGELKENAPTHHIKRPDVTKLVRAVEDALTGVVWPDDSQVMATQAVKVYADPGAQPGARIKIYAARAYGDAGIRGTLRPAALR